MDALKEIPTWLALAGTMLGSIIGGVWWVASSLSNVKLLIERSCSDCRHDMRGEIQSMVGKIDKDIDDINARIRQEDLESERRTDRQIDDLKQRVERIAARCDARRPSGCDD
jgi:hypothetical protein